MPITDYDGTAWSTWKEISDYDGTVFHPWKKADDYDGTAWHEIFTAEIIVVGAGAETTDFITGGFSTWTGGWMNACNTSSIQFCGGDGQQSSGGQSNNYLPDGYSEITINWSMWSDTDGYSGGVILEGSDGSQIFITSGTTYSLKKGVRYKVRFAAQHTYSRTVSVAISHLVLS